MTCYTGHTIVIAIIGLDGLVVMMATSAYLPLVMLVIATAITATTWRWLLGRGPLEWIVHKTTKAVAQLADR